MPRGERRSPVELHGAAVKAIMVRELAAAEALVSDARALWPPRPGYLDALRRMDGSERVMKAAAWLFERWPAKAETMIVTLLEWAATCVAEERVFTNRDELAEACKAGFDKADALRAEADAFARAGDRTPALDALHGASFYDGWAKRRVAMAEGRGSPGDPPVVIYFGRKKDRAKTLGQATLVTLTRVMRAHFGNSMRGVCAAFAQAAAGKDVTRDQARRVALKV